MRFQCQILAVTVLVTAGCAALSCSALRKKAPPREVIENLLRQEAESLKKDGEKVDPSLGVEVTWNIQSIDVREQAGNESQPWAGTIRFEIVSQQAEYAGRIATHRFKKEFDYVWDMATERWVIN